MPVYLGKLVPSPHFCPCLWFPPWHFSAIKNVRKVSVKAKLENVLVLRWSLTSPQIKAQIIHSKLHSVLEGGKSTCLASPQPAARRRGATIPMLHSCYFTNQAWECLCCAFSCCFYTERETPWGQCCEKTEVETHPCTIGWFFLFCTERGKVWPSHHTFSCEVILWCVSGKGVGSLIALPSSTSIQPDTLCSQCLVFSQGRRIWERLTVIDTLQMANTLIWEGRGA